MRQIWENDFEENDIPNAPELNAESPSKLKNKKRGEVKKAIKLITNHIEDIHNKIDDLEKG